MSTADSVPTPDSNASADPPTAVPLAGILWTVVTPLDDRRDCDMLTGVWSREAPPCPVEEEDDAGGGGPDACVVGKSVQKEK